MFSCIEKTKLKLIAILIIVTAILGTAVFFVYGPGKKQIKDVKTGGLIYYELNTADVTTVKIKKGEASVTLKLVLGKWAIETLNNYPVDEDKIKGFLEKTKVMKKEDVRGTNPDKFAKFEVDNQGLLVEMLDSSGKTLAYFHIGKNAENYQSTYVRLFEGNEVIVTGENMRAACSDDNKFWIKRSALGIDQQKIKELAISSVIEGQTTAQVIRLTKIADAAPKWVLKEPVDAPADQATASAVTGAAANLNIDDIVKDVKELKEYGLDVPAVTATVTLEDGTARKVSIGKDDGSTHSYVMVDDKPFVLLCGKSQADNFRKKAEEYIDKQVCAVDADNLTKIEISRPEIQDVVLVRDDKSKEWSLAGGAGQGGLKLQTVNSIVNTVTSLRANSALLDASKAEIDPGKYMEKLVITETGDKKTVLYILKLSSDNASYYVKKEDGNTIYAIGKGFGDNLLKQYGDFIEKKEETEQPKPPADSAPSNPEGLEKHEQPK
ncbi:MAG: DUF4340 domain-containing protein [Planctomycetes bacterium]|nr:DUF4340 domain-containing protein [Planctomycetota bacterium]